MLIYSLLFGFFFLRYDSFLLLFLVEFVSSLWREKERMISSMGNVLVLTCLRLRDLSKVWTVLPEVGIYNVIIAIRLFTKAIRIIVIIKLSLSITSNVYFMLD